MIEVNQLLSKEVPSKTEIAKRLRIKKTILRMTELFLNKEIHIKMGGLKNIAA